MTDMLLPESTVLKQFRLMYDKPMEQEVRLR